MEVAVAVLGAVVSAAVPKLCTVINKLTEYQPKIDAESIKDELELIQGLIQDHPSIVRDNVSSPAIWITQLRRLAYDIEDCIDRFDAKMTNSNNFALEIAGLKHKAEEKGNQLLRYMKYDRSLTHREAPPAARIQRQQVPPAAVVPEVLQRLFGNKSQYGIVIRNCLLYLCLFPPNHHVRRNPLIRRWLAEGLVQGEKDAVENLKILINSSIINSIQKSNNGKMKRCQPADEMLKYISQQSMSENFMLFCDDAAQLQNECARRLSVYPNGAANIGQNLPVDLSHLRTLAVFPADANLAPADANLATYGAILDFTRYEVLRVLDLKECAHLSVEHLEAICDQSLMKYLSIGGSIDRIPKKIGELKQLETLDLSGSEIVTVYKEVLLLPKLKHLLGKFQLSRSDTFAVLGCGTSKVEKFLKDKSVLETLAGFVTGERKGFPQLMSLMRRLRKVKIWCKSNASKANLDDISRAIKKFICDGNDGSPRSLSIDVQECSGEFLNTLPVGGSLASLKLRGKLSQFPPFVARLCAIEELCLWSTTLSWKDILAGLSELRILKYLKLIEDNLGSVKIPPYEHLRSLQRICLVSVAGLDITIKAGALPRLVSLHLICQNLRVTPKTLGMEITHMEKLKEVALHPQVDQTIRNTWQEAATRLQVVTGIPNASGSIEILR